MAAIEFFSEEIPFKLPNPTKTAVWLKKIALSENRTIESLTYVFCSDEYLHSLNKEYLNLNNEEKNQLMSELKQEAIDHDKEPSFFLIARDLTILGYFSSEIGCTMAREYLPIPGKYDGNVEYKPSQKAWAT